MRSAGCVWFGVHEGLLTGSSVLAGSASACLQGAAAGGEEGGELLEDYDTPEAAAKAAAAYAASRGKGGLESAEWRPPPGQSGDGRSVLNDKLGY